MNKSIVSSLIFITTLASTVALHGQSSFEGLYDEITISGDSLSSTFYDHIQLVNNSGADLQLQWKRVEDIGPANWTSSVCDPIACHAEETDSFQFTLPSNPGPNDYINVHFYPHGQGGAGRVKVRVTNINNHSDYIVLTYNGTTDGTILPSDTSGNQDTATVGVSDPNAQRQASVFPNPAVETVTIRIPGIIGGQLDMTSLNGEKLVSYRMDAEQVTIPVADMANGIYLISIRDEKGLRLYRQKIVITD